MKILVCERDFLPRSELLVILEPYGDCRAATDGEEAWRALLDASRAGEGFDLVLLDARMHLRDGGDILEALRALEAESGRERCQVLVRDREDDADGLSDGAYRLPVTADSIAAQLAAVGIGPVRQA